MAVRCHYMHSAASNESLVVSASVWWSPVVVGVGPCGVRAVGGDAQGLALVQVGETEVQAEGGETEVQAEADTRGRGPQPSSSASYGSVSVLSCVVGVRWQAGVVPGAVPRPAAPAPRQHRRGEGGARGQSHHNRHRRQQVVNHHWPLG